MKTPNPSGFGLEDPPTSSPHSHQLSKGIALFAYGLGSGNSPGEPRWTNLTQIDPQLFNKTVRGLWLQKSLKHHHMTYAERGEKTTPIFSKKTSSFLSWTKFCSCWLSQESVWLKIHHQPINEAFFQHLCRCDWRAWISKDVDLWYGPQGEGCHHNGNQQTCLHWKPATSSTNHFFWGVPCFFFDWLWVISGWIFDDFYRRGWVMRLHLGVDSKGWGLSSILSSWWLWGCPDSAAFGWR